MEKLSNVLSDLEVILQREFIYVQEYNSDVERDEIVILNTSDVYYPTLYYSKSSYQALLMKFETTQKWFHDIDVLSLVDLNKQVSFLADRKNVVSQLHKDLDVTEN